jgi:hypothetical protein
MLRHKKVGKYIRPLDPDSNQSAVRIQTQREAKLSQKKEKFRNFMPEEPIVGLEASREAYSSMPEQDTYFIVTSL